MDFGVVSHNTEYGIRPDVVAREAEQRGYESVWFPEHTHIPVSRESPWPMGSELPEEYKHFMDPFVSMMATASATSTIKIGCGIVLLAQHDPIIAAKALATVDVLSGGRVQAGFGGGWNREETANHGSRYEDRWKILRERIAAMKVIWTQEQATYRGEFVDFDPIWCYPKPVQKPCPPVYLGAVSGAGLQRVVDYCDGWMLVDPRDGTVQKARSELAARCEKVGRNPDSINFTVFATTELDNELPDEYANAGDSSGLLEAPSDKGLLQPRMRRGRADARSLLLLPTHRHTYPIYRSVSWG